MFSGFLLEERELENFKCVQYNANSKRGAETPGFVADEGEKKETKQSKEVLAIHAYAGLSPTAVKFQQCSNIRPAYRLQQ